LPKISQLAVIPYDNLEIPLGTLPAIEISYKRNKLRIPIKTFVLNILTDATNKKGAYDEHRHSNRAAKRCPATGCLYVYG
jgi:hypothetical protein